MERTVTSVLLQDTVNPTNGEKGQRLAAKTNLGETIRIWLRDATLEDTLVELRKDASAIIKRLTYYMGEYGAYYMISGATTTEEFK